MLKYKFYLNEIGTPQFGIDGGLYDLCELGSLNSKLLNDVVINIRRVMNVEVDIYSFGYEVYTIECRKETASIIDTFDNWKVIYELPTLEIYHLMKNWQDFLQQNQFEIK